MRVVPVSIADKVLESVTAAPLTVRLDRVNSQKEGVDTRLRNSIVPLKSVEFVPPRVKRPPGDRDVGVAGLRSRPSQNDISGALNRLLLVRVCQKGIDLVAERD